MSSEIGGGAGAPEAAAEGGRQRMIGMVLITAAMACFILSDAAAKRLTADHQVAQIIWVRYLFHLLAMVVLLAPFGRLTVRTARLPLQLGRSLFLLLATYCFITGLSFLPMAEATTLLFLAPLLITALSVPLLGEHVGFRRWTAVIVGFAGVLIVTRPGLGVMHPATGVVLIAALAAAFYQITTRKLSSTDNAYTTLFYTAITGVVVFGVAAPFTWRPPTPTGWALMAWTGVASGLGHFLFIRAHHLAQVAVLAPFLYSQLVFATIVGFLVFGDLPDAWTGIGALVIISSGLYVFYRERRPAAVRP
jgi:drug/metabolite transporter (DMT)-like permease